MQPSATTSSQGRRENFDARVMTEAAISSDYIHRTGDHVRVEWNGKLYWGEVVSTQNSGRLNVRYECDGQMEAGVDLSRVKLTEVQPVRKQKAEAVMKQAERKGKARKETGWEAEEESEEVDEEDGRHSSRGIH